MTKFLTYHAIEDPANSVYTVSPMQFEEHLKMAIEVGKDAQNGVGNVGITFDDGHLSNYENALPVLEKHSQPGIFFVVASFIGTRSDYMTWSQLRELSKLGHEVQSHSWSHPMLTHCSEQQLRDELVRSKNTLQDNLGKCIDGLGVPGGRWNDRVLRCAAQAGYTRVYVSDPWLTPIKRENVNVYGRLTIKRGIRPEQLRNLLVGRNLYATNYRARYILKETIRKISGDSLYRWIWKLSAKPVREPAISSSKSMQKG